MSTTTFMCECGVSFTKAANLQRHIKEKKDPKTFRCRFKLVSTGKQCEFEVKGQESNLRGHERSEHMQNDFTCMLCGLFIRLRSNVYSHVASCRRSHNIPASDPRHPLDFVAERFSRHGAPDPATPPEGWVEPKSHKEKLADKRREENATAKKASKTSRGKKTEVFPTQPVAGPSHMQDLEPSPSILDIGTSVPSTSHFNEVTQSITQSQQNPGASSSNTTAPLFADFTTSENQLNFPPLLFNNIADSAYQQSSLPFIQPNRSPPAQQRTRSSRRYRPYLYQGLSESTQWSPANPYTSMNTAVASQPILPSRSTQSRRALTTEDFGRLYATEEDISPTSRQTIASRLPASQSHQHQWGPSIPQTGSDSSYRPSHSSAPPTLQNDGFDLPQEVEVDVSQIRPHLHLPTPEDRERERLIQSASLPHWLSADLNPDTMLDTDDPSTSNPVFPLGHPSMAHSGGDAWNFGIPDDRDQRMATSLAREGLQHPLLQLPYEMPYQVQPTTTNSSMIGTSMQMNSGESNPAKPQDVFGEGEFSGYGFGGQNSQEQPYKY